MEWYIHTVFFFLFLCGEKGKRFRYKQFKQLLLSINSRSMEEQREILSSSFSLWKGDLEQIDDVIVIGSRV